MAGGAYSPPGGGFQPPGYAQPRQLPPAAGYGGYGGYGGHNPHAPRPGAPYGIEPTSGLPYSDKQKLIAFLLQFFLGAFGAGRFYTGHIGLGIAQFIVTWVTCGIGSLWPTIDSILMLVGQVPDVDGRPLRD